MNGVNDKIINLAVKEAEAGVKKSEGGPFGAVIFRGNRIIASGHNTVLKDNDPTAHAEMNVLRQAAKKLKSFDLSGCEIYITCEPCPMCLAALYWARTKKIYYGCSRKDAERVGFMDKFIYDVFRGRTRKKIKTVRLGREACLRPFALWRDKKDKKLY